MIKVTESAKEKMIEVLKENNALTLRFMVEGGGCSGFVYNFTIDEVKAEDDFELFLDETHRIIVDSMSNVYLEDVEIDYKKDLMSEAFVINNPNAKTSCGCGNSFSA